MGNMSYLHKLAPEEKYYVVVEIVSLGNRMPRLTKQHSLPRPCALFFKSPQHSSIVPDLCFAEH